MPQDNPGRSGAHDRTTNTYVCYTVIARRWRPQKLDEVIGQRAVTQTLRNAMASGRVAQAFVFAGPRGVGKTTTARILARMLNCANGPTADPCGVCDPCREIAEGRDMDVLEIDAATHTGIDNVREVIISGLAIMPVRDRYKVFIIDEVHQLSASSFNALLKSIEEPPPHVTFIMATTALDKIPETIASRSQVFEFKTISSRAIGDQLKKIAAADGITVSDQAIALVARAAEGSMRDAETAFDQVLAFAGNTVGVDDVALVLGLVGRDLLFDVLTAVADENGAAAFELAGVAVEAGYDLKLLCRELARLVRDLLVLSIDDTRFADSDIAPEQDHDRLKLLLPAVLTRGFAARLRCDHPGRIRHQERRRAAVSAGDGAAALDSPAQADTALRSDRPAAGSPAVGGPRRREGPRRLPLNDRRRPRPPRRLRRPRQALHRRPMSSAGWRARRRAWPPRRPHLRVRRRNGAAVPSTESPSQPPGAGGSLKDTYLEEIRKARGAFHGSFVAPAQRVDFETDRIVFRFSSAQKYHADQVWQNKDWLEKLALQVTGRRLAVAAESASDEASARAAGSSGTAGDQAKQAADLKAEAMASQTVQALLGILCGRHHRSDGAQEEVMNIQNMMKQAQQMQEQMQRKMAEMRIEASAGGGMVTVVVNGLKQVQSLKLDPEVVNKDDVEMLQDLILAAINDATRKADEAMSQQLGGLMGGMKIPGLT